MDIELFFSAVALMLVFEGLMPALFPSIYKDMMERVTNMPLAALRTTGVITMISGALLLYFIRN